MLDSEHVIALGLALIHLGPSHTCSHPLLYIMPPKKKDAADTPDTPAEPNIEAYELPRTLVTRIAKSEVRLRPVPDASLHHDTNSRTLASG
jgi:hypothetical protein